MANEQYSPEQAVTKSRQIDVIVGERKSIHQACKEAGITWPDWIFVPDSLTYFTA